MCMYCDMDKSGDFKNIVFNEGETNLLGVKANVKLFVYSDGECGIDFISDRGDRTNTFDFEIALSTPFKFCPHCGRELKSNS